MLKSSALTHIGTVRKTNEDAIFRDDNAALWAVADGMGGHQAGDYASQCLVEHLQHAANEFKGKALVDQVPAFIEKAHKGIFQYSQTLEQQPIIGTTIVALILEGEHYHCFWSGDSRCYLFRDEKLDQITRDHTEAESLIASGGSINGLTTKEAELAENTLTHAIGIDEHKVHIDYTHDYIYENDRFLLCSDGINKIYSDKQLKQKLLNEDADTSNNSIITQAPNGYMPDNLSSIIVDIT